METTRVTEQWKKRYVVFDKEEKESRRKYEHICSFVYISHYTVCGTQKTVGKSEEASFSYYFIFFVGISSEVATKEPTYSPSCNSKEGSTFRMLTHLVACQ
jgi:hypothetical protein